eukprot:gnl/TRDRNA2_/TRDRNA2_183615_c0_seq1.p1 gnl/TRDRNA2_/TRDRNA2_183615_c0~~gnl/TRDRNA2_/TRDRNA2_183615_c0_seq1.p1  ORF type:complete len:470 (-),score=81.78 gnl/TRDRNA2_/TRDRNA2_183615_c0_seq1:90-1499(-)
MCRSTDSRMIWLPLSVVLAQTLGRLAAARFEPSSADAMCAAGEDQELSRDSSLLTLPVIDDEVSFLQAWSAAYKRNQTQEVSIPRTIKLQKQYVEVKKADKVLAYKTAYFGKVWAASPQPQAFNVVFDTGSGHFILPSVACKAEGCTDKQRYNRSVSESAVDIEYDGKLIPSDAVERDQVSIAFGTGEVQGEFVQEVVCLTPQSKDCAKGLRVVVATEMTADPFAMFKFDGVMGLGLEALTLDPHFSFFKQLLAHNPTMQPRFAFFLAMHDENDSVISFGGHDPRHATTGLSWEPVAAPELGYWQVKIKRVSIGATVLDYCLEGGCRAILDTGTSLLGVPKDAARTLHRLLARKVPQGLGPNIDCRGLEGHSIDFELESGNVINLEAQDYSRQAPFNMTVPNSDKSQLLCRSALLPVDMKPPLGPKVFIWGEPVLRRYYTVYDWAKREIGFSRANQELPLRPEASSITV